MHGYGDNYCISGRLAYNSSMNTSMAASIAGIVLVSAGFAFAQTSVSDTLLNALSGKSTQASATTPTDPNSREYKAAVANVQALIAQLTKVLADLIAKRAAAPQTSLCDPITRPLAVGSRGADVLCLQRFLIKEGHLASDLATGFFGPLTAAAVQLYQSTKNIVSGGNADSTGYGVVGPKTQAAINLALGNFTSSVDAVGSCALDGVVLTHGATGFFYASKTAAKPSDCVSLPRTCSNGVLGGSNNLKYATCAAGVSATAACTFGGYTLSHGQSVTAYQSSSVAAGSVCLSETRTCLNGTLSGSHTNVTCGVQGSTSCSFNGLTLTSGQSVTAYQAATVAYGQSCVSQTRTCSNGSLGGSYAFTACTVAAAPAAASCTLDGVTLQDGQSATFYTASSVAFGGSCSSIGVTRTCSNGTLSGSSANNKSSCSVAAAGSCIFNGQSVAHGASVTAYQASSVAYGQSCTSQSRTCSNGTLSGTYTYASCSVASASSVTPGSQTFTASGTFTVPAHNTLTAQCWGGGGGGANSFLHSNYFPGESLPGYYGGTGGQSSFNGTLIANGGAGGSLAIASEGQGYTPGSGGAGGTASGGDENTAGAAGTAGATDVVYVSSGSGGTAGGSGGGVGGASNTYGEGGCQSLSCDSPGNAGSAPGGGGGGAVGTGSDQGSGGGGGGGGFVKKTYAAGVFTVGSGISVVVGSGGQGGQEVWGIGGILDHSAGGNGARGECRISWQ